MKLNGDNEPIVRSRLPHKLKRGAFLGFRNTKDTLLGGSLLKSTTQPIMPEGGLSPCVIRVMGVGGGGCNAVS
jgi:cell division protein FtsZ